MHFDVTHPYRLVVLLALAAGCGGSMGPDDTGTTPEDAAQDSGSNSNDGSTTLDTATIPMDVAPPVACTSGTHWTRGTHGSASMEPGMACVSCHQMTGGPTLSIGGTVYPSSHEEDTCNGTSGATVEITDSAGQVITLPTNSAGNFYSNARLTFPIHARVMHNGMVNAMITAQTSGDCNSCHTQAGTMAAPGRIVAP